MVDNPVLNHKSIKPIDMYEFKESFNKFLALDKELKRFGFEKYRNLVDRGSLYLELEEIFLSNNKSVSPDLKNRLRIFLDRSVSYQNQSILKDSSYSNVEYLYEDNKDLGILGYADIFQTFIVSFTSIDDFCVNTFKFMKEEIIEDHSEVNIHPIALNVLNIYSLGCIEQYLVEILKGKYNNFLQLGRSEFKETYHKLLSHKNIILSTNVIANITSIDSDVYMKFKEIIFKLSNGIKTLGDYPYSDESDSVKENKDLRDMRKFDFNGNSRYIYKHLKSFAKGHRMYIEYVDSLYYVGYIGIHLRTQKHS